MYKHIDDAEGMDQSDDDDHDTKPKGSAKLELPVDADEDVDESCTTSQLGTEDQNSASDLRLPPIPPVPPEPPFFDPSQYQDKDLRKLAEKEHSRALKAYRKAVKDRDTSIKDRNKLLDKREKKHREKEKQREPTQRLKKKEGREKELRQAMVALASAEENRSRRDKKFCMLPPKVNGNVDRTWVQVHMDGVDEVGAHCGLFLIDAHYERLVGDVGGRIEDWVIEDGSRRLLISELAMQDI
jgi:hypothetical protein